MSAATPWSTALGLAMSGRFFMDHIIVQPDPKVRQATLVGFFHNLSLVNGLFLTCTVPLVLSMDDMVLTAGAPSDTIHLYITPTPRRLVAMIASAVLLLCALAFVGGVIGALRQSVLISLVHQDRVTEYIERARWAVFYPQACAMSGVQLFALGILLVLVLKQGVIFALVCWAVPYVLCIVTVWRTIVLSTQTLYEVNHAPPRPLDMPDTCAAEERYDKRGGHLVHFFSGRQRPTEQGHATRGGVGAHDGKGVRAADPCSHQCVSKGTDLV